MSDDKDKLVSEALCHERRQQLNLSDDQVDLIAERAATKAVAKITGDFYEEIGKAVVSKFLFVIGILSVAFLSWASAKGWLK